MTLQDYLKEKTELLSRAGIDDAENEAWVVLETVSGLNRSSIRFSFAKELVEVISDEVFSSLEKTYERRAEGEPLAYIVGHAPFYDLEFSVGPGVLIPRFDTEILVETALCALRIDGFPLPNSDGPVPQVYTSAPFVIYDLCTGSGCVGITIAHELLKRSIPCRLVMTEISEEAAAFAKENAQEILGTKVAWEVQIADLWPDFSSGKAPVSGADLIVSNPPYITKEEMDELSVEVGEHEPHLALTDGSDGLTFYKRILEGLKDHLKDGGVFAVEHGYMQKDAIRKLMPEEVTDVVCIKDYGDNDRVTCGRKEME